jgi:hypothetical protein
MGPALSGVARAFPCAAKLAFPSDKSAAPAPPGGSPQAAATAACGSPPSEEDATNTAS